MFFYFFIGPYYTNIRAPRGASNEGDLPPGVGAQTWPLTCSLPGNRDGVPLHFELLVVRLVCRISEVESGTTITKLNELA